MLLHLLDILIINNQDHRRDGARIVLSSGIELNHAVHVKLNAHRDIVLIWLVLRFRELFFQLDRWAGTCTRAKFQG